MSVPVRKANDPTIEIRVSAYDRASSWIVALLILTGIAVVCLLTIWLTTWRAAPSIPLPVVLDPAPGGDPNGVPGERLRIEGAERQTISAETDLEQPQLQETMAMVWDSVARKTADADRSALTSDIESGGSRGSIGKSQRRPPGNGLGPGGGPAWEMQYDESTLRVYSEQLDFFGIELAVVGGHRDQIDYASGFTRSAPALRTGSQSEEARSRRTYFTHRSGTVQKYDQQLLARAGLVADGRIILQYYPKAAVDRLMLLEQQYRNLKPEQILKTIFGVRRRGNAFEFFVVDQVRR